MKRILVGCSGWNYRHWRDRFYPKGLPASRWFEFYAEHFDTVEINNSFYRLPPAETFDKWRDQAPAAFCYAVKANRFLTQAKKLKDCAEPLERMMIPFRRLQDRLGPVLYQLPPRLALNLERLESFLLLLPRDVTNVFEFRHASWYVPETLALLDRYGASFCIHDMIGSASPDWVSGPVAYVRFHGGEGKYWGRYPEDTLARRADWMTSQARERTVFGFFNNDLEAHAIDDALTLKAMLAQAVR